MLKVDTLDTRRQTEAARIRDVYLKRGVRDTLPDYSIAAIMAQQERERVLRGEIAKRGWSLADMECLDVGCGTGGHLARLLSYGADPRRLHGVDLNAWSIDMARARLPASDLRVEDASSLPYPDDSMDLVTQQTALSSILDEDVRLRVASEMVRVSRPSGLIMSYDFIINPTNPETRGIKAADLRRLFKGCHVQVHRMTLAPPISRRVAPRSRHVAAALGAIPFLRSHIMAFITKG